MTNSIVFIHGLNFNPVAWGEWVNYFKSAGYICYTPAYPFHKGKPRELRQSYDPALRKLDFAAVVRHIEQFIDKLPAKPILIGHSMGGLVVQKLIERGKGAAGVAINSAPPFGIFTFKPSFYKANFPFINPLKGNSVCLPSVSWFHYAVCNTMSKEETKIAYDKYVVPESRNIPRSTFRNSGRIRFNAPHAPLLFIGGDKDNIVPAALNRKNCKAYTDKKSISELKVFEGRSHFICWQEGWQQVAEYVAAWIKKQGV
jgi:pimeloyl-ACP methyl ester carboxylesterase